MSEIAATPAAVGRKGPWNVPRQYCRMAVPASLARTEKAIAPVTWSTRLRLNRGTRMTAEAMPPNARGNTSAARPEPLGSSVVSGTRSVWVGRGESGTEVADREV